MLLFLVRVVGHSMQPTFYENDRLIVSRIPYIFSDPTINDIVVFRSNNLKLLVKRITKIQKNVFFVEGDNKRDSKEIGFIQRRVIVGKVIGKISF